MNNLRDEIIKDLQKYAPIFSNPKNCRGLLTMITDRVKADKELRQKYGSIFNFKQFKIVLNKYLAKEQQKIEQNDSHLEILVKSMLKDEEENNNPQNDNKNVDLLTKLEEWMISDQAK